MKLLLASQSPRRKELLENIGYQFEVISIDCEENYPSDLPTEKVAGYLSELKANAYQNMNKNEVVLTADTIVSCNGEILGKPKDKEEAHAMLRLLSDNKHQVYTGITLKTVDKTITKTDVAEVEFNEISEEEIEYYIDKYSPFDKAGSYGIQEWLGMAKIKSIQGSFYTIMGLPTHLVYEILKNIESQ